MVTSYQAGSIGTGETVQTLLPRWFSCPVDCAGSKVMKDCRELPMELN